MSDYSYLITLLRHEADNTDGNGPHITNKAADVIEDLDRENESLREDNENLRKALAAKQESEI